MGKFAKTGKSSNGKTRITKKSVPSVPRENGSNDHSLLVTAKYKYDLVLNNWTDAEYNAIISKLSEKCAKFIVGKEIGEEGTPHLQCAITLKVKERITGITKWTGFTRCSLRETRNDEALSEYCRKGGDFVSFGYPKPLKLITVLRPWQQDVKDLVIQEPDDRTITWIWGAKGGEGKTQLAKYLCYHHNALYAAGSKTADIMNLVFNSDMDKHRIVIWNMPRDTDQWGIKYTQLEQVKDGIIFNGKYETGMKLYNSPHIVVFANFAPDGSKMSEDRWKVITL